MSDGHFIVWKHRSNCAQNQSFFVDKTLGPNDDWQLIWIIAMAKLTTHVLDTAHGKPAAGVRVALHGLRDGHHIELVVTETNADGRSAQPLLEGSSFESGEYELEFFLADYFRRQTLPLAEPPFLSTVVVRFFVADASQHYHVPLLFSPWSYSTYRGS